MIRFKDALKRTGFDAITASGAGTPSACIGFPFWIAFAWFYEFTPQGLKRESDIAPADSIAHSTGRKLDRWIIVVLNKGMTRWRVGDQAGALDYIHRGGAMGTPFGTLTLAFYDAAHGNVQASAAMFAKSESKMGSKIPRAELQTIYLGSYDDKARQAALNIIAAHEDDDWAPTLLLQLDEPARSFALYEHGHSGLSDGYLNWLWQMEPWSRKARRDPAFQGFAQRLGMVAYWQRYGWPDLCQPVPAKGPDAFVCH